MIISISMEPFCIHTAPVSSFDQELVDVSKAMIVEVEGWKHALSVALVAIWKFVSRTNKYIDENNLGRRKMKRVKKKARIMD